MKRGIQIAVMFLIAFAICSSYVLAILIQQEGTESDFVANISNLTTGTGISALGANRIWTNTTVENDRAWIYSLDNYTNFSTEINVTSVNGNTMDFMLLSQNGSLTVEFWQYVAIRKIGFIFAPTGLSAWYNTGSGTYMFCSGNGWSTTHTTFDITPFYSLYIKRNNTAYNLTVSNSSGKVMECSVSISGVNQTTNRDYIWFGETTPFYYLGNVSFRTFCIASEGDVCPSPPGANATSIKLWLNDTEANMNLNWSQALNATAKINITGLWVAIEKNGTLIANDTTSSFNITAWEAGYHQIRSYYSGNASFNPSEKIYYANISRLPANLSMTSSNGWSLMAGGSTNITCVGTNGNPTLYKDGVSVTNPQVSSYSAGAYNFTCTLEPAENNYTAAPVANTLNVIATGVGCINNQTYAYYANIPYSASQIALNFTDLVNAHIVKSSLDDVWVNTSNTTINKNTTNGYYILVNSSNVTNFDIYFGNYPINNTIALANRSNETLTNFSYMQSSLYITTLNLIEEMTGNLLNPTANTSITLFCDSGMSMFNTSTSDTQFTLATNSQLRNSEYTVKYSITEIYYRNLIHTYPVENRNYYLVDANKDQVVQILLQLQDNSGLFGSSNLHIKKQIGESLATITERPFDAEKKAIIYLINGQQYQITVSQGSAVRTIGNIYIDTVNLVKTIVIGNLVTLNITEGNISYSLNYNRTTGLIEFSWNDPYNQTVLTELSVFNYTNMVRLFYTNSTNSSNIMFSYTVPNVNNTYIARLHVKHLLFGLNSQNKDFVLEGTSNLPSAKLPDLSTINPHIFLIAGGIFLVALPLVFGPIHGKTAGIITGLFAIMLIYFGWPIFGQPYATMMILATSVVVFMVMNKMVERRLVS